MEEEEARPVRTEPSEKGFTLAEALVVVGIIGIIGMIATVQVSNFVNKANLEGAGAQVRGFLDAVKSETVKARGPITVDYGVVPNSYFETSLRGKTALRMWDGTNTVRKALRFPDYVAWSVNPGTAAPPSWPASPTPVPASTFGAGLFTCDMMGRTLVNGSQTSTTQMISITHRGMLDQSGFAHVRPRLRYDIQLYPLWALNVTKNTY
jgi:prepilin-type N-terminal cleavage/methylation domain-containing protein